MKVLLSVTPSKGLANWFYQTVSNMKVIFKGTESMGRAGSIQREDRLFMESGRIQDW